MLCLFFKSRSLMLIFGQTFFLELSLVLLLGCRLSVFFDFPLLSAELVPDGACSAADYRSEGRLIQSPPGRGSEPCRFNSESETRVVFQCFFCTVYADS